MQKRSYKVTFGLQEGYEPQARIHTPSFAAQVITDWIAARIKGGKPVVSGFMQAGMMIAPGVGQQPVATASPTCVFAGELSSKEDVSRSDEEVRSTLEDLAETLKEALNQESVYIIYLEDNWCV